MSRKTISLIVGVVLICVLFGAYFGLRSYNEKQEEADAEAAAGEDVLEIDPDQITEISFTIDGEEVSFALDEDDTWKKADDEDFPVKETTLRTPLNQLTPLRAVRILSDPEDPSEYGLDEPQQVFTITDENGNTTVLAIGDTNDVTGDDYLMMNGDESVVYTISTGLRESFSEDLYDYAVSEDLPNIQTSEVTDITVQKADGDGYDLSLTDAVWMVDGNEADSDAANELASAAGTLAYAGYYEYNCTDPAAYGLADPAAVLTVTWQEPVETEEESEAEEPDEEETAEEAAEETTEEDSKEEDSEEEETEEETQTEIETQYEVFDVTFYIGDEDDEGDYYVQLEGSTEVHSISADTLDILLDTSAAELAENK